MNAFSPAQFRAQFPALADAGIYLDSAATALKPQAVIEATRQFYSLSAGNVHRSQYADAQRLTAQYEAARDQVARLINADSGKNIVWTRGTTEAINMVAQCYARPLLQPGMRSSSARRNTTPTGATADGGRTNRGTGYKTPVGCRLPA